MLSIEDWRDAKDFCEAASEDWFRETVISTMEPEVMDGGRSMEGNSIWELMEAVSDGFLGMELEHCVPLKTHKALVLSEKNGDTSIDFADGERYQHVDLDVRL